MAERKLTGGWGNGVVDTSQGEEWDDKNNTSEDGCSSTCIVETSFIWTGSPSIWEEWGDGKVEGAEKCDDGNTKSGDGWSSSWIVESGWRWNKAEPSVCMKWGNGMIEGTETCDDGNRDFFNID